MYVLSPIKRVVPEVGKKWDNGGNMLPEHAMARSLFDRTLALTAERNLKRNVSERQTGAIDFVSRLPYIIFDLVIEPVNSYREHDNIIFF